ncbi:MAG: hypothetical protein HUU46_07600 [Candidatus Hydrogenedentes bacterium]|nr:hypothetical protein [Candidatus Hydrogenedentota bacterium]
MDTDQEIRKLIRARKQIERRLHELDQKVEHLIYGLKEDRRCFGKKCAFEDIEQQMAKYWR